MGLRFEWDPGKAASNRRKHDVSFLEAATVFGDPLGGIIDDPDHSTTEARLVIIGMSEKFRLLVVVFVEESRTIRIISARRASKRERQQLKGDKKVKASETELRKEYDFSKARPNKYAKRYSEGASLVVIDPALRKRFPDSASVNAALRSLVSAFPEEKSK